VSKAFGVKLNGKGNWTFTEILCRSFVISWTAKSLAELTGGPTLGVRWKVQVIFISSANQLSLSLNK
jgi:hypothetical protein